MIAAETPDSSMIPFFDSVAPTQRMSTSIGPDRTAADDHAAGRRVVGDRVGDGAGHLGPVVDDLERRHDELGRAHHVVDPRARAPPGLRP